MDSDESLPPIEIKIKTTEVRAEPRRLEHKDGSPILWPQCFYGQCPIGECRPMTREVINE